MTQICKTRRRGATRPLHSCSQEVALDGSGHHESGSDGHLFPPLCRPHFPRSLGRAGRRGGGARCSRAKGLRRDVKGEPRREDSLGGEHHCMASSGTENHLQNYLERPSYSRTQDLMSSLAKMSHEKRCAKTLLQSSAPARKPQKQFPVALGYKMDQALISEYVPIVIHPGGLKPEYLSFAFYNPNYSNSYSPFYTLQKPTCGYRYCRDTDHRRKVLDVERANIPKWRTIVGKSQVWLQEAQNSDVAMHFFRDFPL